MTQPIKQWSSGCIFKNPSKDTPASLLIDSLGIDKKKNWRDIYFKETL